MKSAWKRWVVTSLLIVPFFAALPAVGRSAQDEDERVRLYVGTYTRGKSEGIYVLDLNLRSGQLTPVTTVSGVADPSFLAIHPGGKFLYAVNEIGNFEGTDSGAVSAFEIDAESGDLKLLNQQSSLGGAPCHLVVDRTGRCVLVANYSGGNVAALPIDSTGRLGPAKSIRHRGSSVDPNRQKGPHAHSINLDAQNRFAVAADLGLDQLLIYRLDPAEARLTPHDPPAVDLKPGAGPRHFAFHPDGKFAYCINEIDSTVTALSYDAEQGTLKPIHSLSTLPDSFQGRSHTADVHVSPDGRFLYGSNRGHDSIAVFAVDRETGRLTAVGHQSTMGKTPRNFAIDPTGTFLLAENQSTDDIVVFRIDKESGLLKPTGHKAEVPSPVCIRFLP